ncbi:hypothetical protein [Paraburkholderia caballeronis]|uniref:hypothetical protein n=1 Tax=Paraburkholderia caballeronis TaxID=416943 RepID=UPI0010665D9C|nr:hypothetical protein [Paraburkholderia caballeronis]
MADVNQSTDLALRIASSWLELAASRYRTRAATCLVSRSSLETGWLRAFVTVAGRGVDFASALRTHAITVAQ